MDTLTSSAFSEVSAPSVCRRSCTVSLLSSHMSLFLMVPFTTWLDCKCSASFLSTGTNNLTDSPSSWLRLWKQKKFSNQQGLGWGMSHQSSHYIVVPFFCRLFWLNQAPQPVESLQPNHAQKRWHDLISRYAIGLKEAIKMFYVRELPLGAFAKWPDTADALCHLHNLEVCRISIFILVTLWCNCPAIKLVSRPCSDNLRQLQKAILTLPTRLA